MLKHLFSQQVAKQAKKDVKELIIWISTLANLSVICPQLSSDVFRSQQPGLLDMSESIKVWQAELLHQLQTYIVMILL